MQIPKKLTDFLNRAEIKYEVLHHPEAYSSQQRAQAEHVKGRYHAKVVVVKSNGKQSLAVLPADRLLDLEKFERLTGKPAKLADEKEIQMAFPDCAVGAMPPFGSLYGLPTYVDQSLTDDEFVVFEAGTHTDAIKLSYKDFARVADAKVADFAIRTHSMKAA
jgi:Ala-tRNA(Pro) deacylase